MSHPLSRRSFLVLGGGAVAGLAMPVTADGFWLSAAENEEARAYYRLLLLHTRLVESLWDESAGHYPLDGFDFVHVLGNAVLLRFGSYDAALAGVSRETLRDHTLRTIAHFAAANFWATGRPWGGGGYQWGGRIFWDATMESYFVAAARLVWDELTPATRGHVEAISIRAADYTTGLGATEDPRSGGWTSNGLRGGFRGDSKIEEMGAKSMPIATGLAYFPGHASAPRWREWLTRWMSNMTGLPSADERDGTLLDGQPVSWWNEAQNLYESHVVENHGSYGPMYQASVGAYPGRNAIHFLLAGRPLPDVFGYQPNAAGLWRTMRHLGMDSGLSAHPMVADRYHLYGRDVLPLTWRRLGQADTLVARSERMLISHLKPYLLYPPLYRLAKFTGEAKYEAEARAEVAIAYLLHVWRDRLRGDVLPTDEAAYWADVAGVTDYGQDVGLVGHQSAGGLALVVTKPNYVKFAFLAEHDDWLFDASGNQPAFLPTTAVAVAGRKTAVYRRGPDGFDATATVLQLNGGFAGYSTLPGGEVVYASSGHSTGEGALRLHTLDMPGVRGLDGNRTFHGPGGPVTLAGGLGDGGADELSFPATAARYVRMIGVRPANQYGYSLWAFKVFGGGVDLALGRPVTASSFDPAFPPGNATDGQPGTRWAVARTERTRPDSWLTVDLGAVRQVSSVTLLWEAACGAEYRLQVSTDGTAWRDAARVPAAHVLPIRGGAGDGGTDRLWFPVTSVRHVRMLGSRPANQYGYSIWSFEVFGPGGGTDLARGRPVSVSSFDPAFPPGAATDGQPGTRWAVAVAQRSRLDSWLAVDLGAMYDVDRVTIAWEAAYGAAYRIQVSPDGSTWRDVVTVPTSGALPSGWTNLDDRVGFVLRGGRNPIRVTATSLTLSDGPAAGSAGLVVEGYPGQPASRTAALAARPGPVAEPAALVAGAAAGYLSLFNLSGQPVDGRVRLARADAVTTIHLGSQTIDQTGHTVTAQVVAAGARVLPPVFDLSLTSGGAWPALTAVASDRLSVTLAAPAGGQPAGITVRCLATDQTRSVTVPAGGSVTVTFG